MSIQYVEDAVIPFVLRNYTVDLSSLVGRCPAGNVSSYSACYLG